ncbi:hypothetical protein K504DRAFT_493609 [Pleomassaria siparia CBS 279.74]|uniref:NAD(P)-binding protein n=1 Tax=Pleomassaria siparia CBS 279.74 TaxID=1314801 RepID=A0A6G1JYN6_9PLEO|nr:hypothetical protein K504DRAFT_493609 [Pleomassaria siparia CBS 279.74]
MPVDYYIKGKVTALTGATSGIGYETAFLLARQGAYRSIADISEAALTENTADIEKVSTGKVLSAVVDARKDESVTFWIARPVEASDKLNRAVNLANLCSARMSQILPLPFPLLDQIDTLPHFRASELLPRPTASSDRPMKTQETFRQ